MNTIRIAAFAATALCHAAIADDSDAYTQMINKFAGCSMYWDIYAELFRADQPATAKQMAELGNGAELAALYMLSLEHRERTGESRPLSSFNQYVASRRDVTKTTVEMFIEQGNSEAITKSMSECQAILEFQEQVIQQVRDSAYR